ncbi:Rossmann-fold NAD(P)-binding domain-containing protein [Oceanivirga salmonicida]|uniref:hypothetical protein n=1 Tax=Oceanivirga salmonicida TaxID=1769291 RepID=UPI00082BC9AC|nr:hypothetical protein [Oceanivirga salmonicida]
MIYIVEQYPSFDILEKFLKEKSLKYTKLNISIDELNELIESKKYRAIFISSEYENMSNFIYIKDGEIIKENLLYNAFSNFLEKNNIDMNDKRVLLLGSSENSRMVYKVLKDKYNLTVFIASITEEPMNLGVGDRRIKKVEITNMKSADFIINTTHLGMENAENTCMLENNNVIKCKNVIDLIFKPEKTSLLLKYEIKGAKIYNGLEIEKEKYIYALNLI